ncbi:MAG: effector-associated domain EAD1-containing protein [Mastigocoleus sp. MO_167.B18]|nr:effector-associated domain EAD1-containing protein [Mastigocoleus sp. MO_167.B18]
MGLSGSQRQQLQNALMDAFPKKSSLEQMLSFELDEKLNTIASEGNLNQIVFELIKEAEAQNWVEDLVIAARKKNPGNQHLKDVAKILGIASVGEKATSQKPFQAPPLPTYYVNRPEYSQDLKTRLLTESSDVRTLVVTAIHGLGSVGKSTLAAALAHDEEVQAHFSDGILWATLGQQPNVLSLLSGWVQALGDYSFKATSVEATSNQLRTLLYDKAVLLVVDDAWNTIDAQAFNVGGARCQVLVTTREGAIATVLKASTYSLDVMQPEQAMELLTKKLGREITGTEHQSVQDLAKAVGYLPLALELVAAEVASGTTWADLLEDFQQEVARLKNLDRPEAEEITEEAILKRFSLTASLNLSVKRMPTKKQQYFSWLGVLPEDVTITKMITATLWEMDQRSTAKMLQYLWNKALLLSGVPLADGTPTYRLHDLFHDLACNLLTAPQNPEDEGDLPGLGMTLPAAHGTFLEKYRNLTNKNLWHTLSPDGYIHQHLVWHLEKAQKVEEIHKLLAEESKTGGNGWYEACEHLGQTANFVTDVARAWQLTEVSWAETPLTLPQVVSLQCRYALINVSLNSMAANLPIELLIALVKENLWTPEQGLAYALQNPNPNQKVSSLNKLVIFLPPNQKKIVLEKALFSTREIQDERYRTDALRNLVPKLTPELLPEALATTREIRDEKHRTDALSKLVIKLPELLPEALATAREIRDEKHRTDALRDLVPKLTPELLPEALATAREIRNEKHRTDALRDLVPRLTPELLPEALATAREIQSEWLRVKALSILADKLPELLPQALHDARKIKYKEYRVKALNTLVNKLPELLPEILDAARKIKYEYDRVDALNTLADKMPELLLDTLITLQDIQYERHRAKILNSLAGKLPPDLLSEALAIAREIQDERYHTDALRNLVPKLPELLPEALAAARKIEDEKYYANTLISLADKLPLELLPEALAAAREIRDEKYYANALISLADKLPLELLPEALAAARKIQDEEYRVNVLNSLAKKLPPELLLKTLAATREIQDKRYCANVLSSLAEKLPELLPQVMTAREIEDEEYRANVLTTLADKLPLELLPEALAAARDIEDKECHANALSTLAHKLSQIQKTELSYLWRDTLHTLSLHTRPELLSDIKALTPVIFALGGEQAVKDTASTIQDVSQWWP